ncbi:Hypothetical predicted protein [Mytilus galloprovincialis]|uniref:Uncharacterized protein n=1 Tax=Mytilus galloprovincialis TaxID=29158 RepID=A0A8B6FJN2_MYTGA|nr:Hypothetical predicted protein [Mytilus galloprovincialis]
MADSSAFGLKLVQEYTANPLADDSEDDRKIFRAQNRAERKIKADRVKRRSRADPYEKPESSSGSRDRQTLSRKLGVCYNCYKPVTRRMTVQYASLAELALDSDMFLFRPMYRSKKNMH